jgi:hypothetical protein
VTPRIPHHRSRDSPRHPTEPGRAAGRHEDHSFERQRIGLLSNQETAVCTNARTGLSRWLPVGFSSLKCRSRPTCRIFPIFGAHFGSFARTLKIPRSQVRSLPGPLGISRIHPVFAPVTVSRQLTKVNNAEPTTQEHGRNWTFHPLRR